MTNWLSTNPFKPIRSALTSLTVGKGGKSSRKELSPDWTIDFGENWDRETRDQRPYTLTLGNIPTNRSSTVYLTMDDVYTKSRSMWRRDSVWRLKPETVERMALSIENVMAKEPPGST